MVALLIAVTVVGFDQEVYMVSEANASVTLSYSIRVPDDISLFDMSFFVTVDVAVVDGTAIGQEFIVEVATRQGCRNHSSQSGHGLTRMFSS